MHSYIIQTSFSPIKYDERIEPSDYWDYNADWFDYIGELVSIEEAAKKLAQTLKMTYEVTYDEGENPLAVLTVTEETLRLKEQWLNEFKAMAYVATKDAETFTKYIHRLKELLTQPFDIDWRFAHEGDLDDSPSEFVSIVTSCKVGDKLYIGNVIDFHW